RRASRDRPRPYRRQGQPLEHQHHRLPGRGLRDARARGHGGTRRGALRPPPAERREALSAPQARRAQFRDRRCARRRREQRAQSRRPRQVACLPAPRHARSRFHPRKDHPVKIRFATAAIALAASVAAAQDYPSKPVTFVVPFAAGSATDQLARGVGQAMYEATKQTVVVDDKPGASGFLAAQHVARAAPDGYTVLITTNTTHAANEHLYKSLPYDPVKDFAPVTL